MFKNAKVGDKVWDICRGWGEIISITRTSDYPVQVRFPVTAVSTYTFEGKTLCTNINPSIYWDEILIDPPKKPLPDLPVDTKVLVWNDGDDVKRRRHFYAFNENGSVSTWCEGATSFTSEVVSTWDNWELYEESDT